MALPYPTDPSLPANPAPLFSDSTAARGDHLRANNAEIWANFTEIVGTMLGNASLSIDGTFSALSDLLFPSEKAVDTYLRSVVYSILPVLGATLKFERTYTPISASNPWFCLSLPDQNWTTTNYSSEFISEMRTRKVIYDEMGASPVSSFGGEWAGDTFTLTDNTANVAMITALAREYLYAGSPISGWRLLHDGTNEFNIIAISVSARTIQVNLDSKTAAGSAIEIYRHRVYGSTTSARHFSEAGLGFYQAGGDKISGLRRLDQMQGQQTIYNYRVGTLHSATNNNTFLIIHYSFFSYS